MLVSDLLVEAARIRGDSDTINPIEEVDVSERAIDECQMGQIVDIKQRWALRRKNSKQLRRRLPLRVKSRTCH